MAKRGLTKEELDALPRGAEVTDPSDGTMWRKTGDTWWIDGDRRYVDTSATVARWRPSRTS